MSRFNPCRPFSFCLLAGALFVSPPRAEVAIHCERNFVANIVTQEQPLMYNRLGAQNANGMIYALRSDVVR